MISSSEQNLESMRLAVDGFFSLSQKDILSQLLRVRDDWMLTPLLYDIVKAVLQTRELEAADENRAIGSQKDAKALIEKIETSARQLQSLIELEEVPLSRLLSDRHDLLCFEKSPGERSGSSAAQERSENILALLKHLRVSCAEMLNRSPVLRAAFDIYPAAWPKNSIVSATLWPVLFSIWMWNGRKVASSFDPDKAPGPMERFFAIVHEAAGLPPPNRDTLKTAALRQRSYWWEENAWTEDPPPGWW